VVLQFVGTVMRRSALEASGGFMPRLEHAADWEMWLRLTGSRGLVMSAETLACYRVFAGTDTSRLARRAGNVLDVDALLSIATVFGLDMDADAAMAKVRAVAVAVALGQHRAMRAAGDHTSSRPNFGYWVRRASPGELAGYVGMGLRRRAGLGVERVRRRVRPALVALGLSLRAG